MKSSVIVRYGELALKSEPIRRRFERELLRTMRRVLDGLKYEIRVERGRIFVDTKSTATTIKRLKKIPGIVSLSPSARTSANMNDIRIQAVRVASRKLRPGMSFAVRTVRVGEHPFSSRDVNNEVGAAIISEFKNKVNLSSPDLEISVEIRGGDAYVFTNIVRGVGGLPVGSQGKVLAIFSGTKGEAAASFMVLKRGCKVALLFLDPHDDPNGPRARRVSRSAKKLSEFDPTIELWSFPFKEILAAMSVERAKGKASYICPRSILRAAGMVAGRVRAEAVVLGDHLEQLVAQKLANLKLIDEACNLPVLRPLAMMEEMEVEEIAQKTEVRPLPGSPSICPTIPEIPSLEEILKKETEINIYAITNDASEKLRKIKIR